MNSTRARAMIQKSYIPLTYFEYEILEHHEHRMIEKIVSETDYHAPDCQNSMNCRTEKPIK